MSEPTIEPTIQPRSRDAAADLETVPRVVPAARTGGARTPDAAWTEVQAILDGRGNRAELVALVGQLDAAHRAQLRDKLANVAVLSSGDVTIDVGEIIEAPVADVLKQAFGALLGTPSAPRLARYLAVASSDDLAALEPAVLDVVLGRFGGQPMLSVVPKAGVEVLSYANHPRLLRWFVTSTPAAVVADLMGLGGSDSLGQALEAEHLWRPWIDHIRVAHDRYQYLAGGTKDAEVRRKLLAPYGKRVTSQDGDGQGHPTVDAVAPEAAGELDAALVTGASRDRLLEAISAAGGVTAATAPAVLAALRRTGATADDVLAIGLEVERPDATWLQLLLASPRVSSAHVLAYLGAKPVKVSQLTDAAVAQLRARTGGALHLRQLAPKEDPAGHKAIVEREPLRQWFLDDAVPAELLWLCAAEPELAGRATRAVAARFGGFGWVHKLTGGEDHAQLRSLALSCNDAAAAKFIHDDLLHDHKREGEFGGEAMSSRAFGGEVDRLRIAIQLGDSDVVLQRIADLDDAARRAFGKDAAAVAQLGDKVAFTEAQFARAAHLLDLSYHQSLAICPGGPGVLGYLSTRPPGEDRAALADAAVVSRAARLISHDLFLVFPSLAQRAVLARAVDTNPALLRLLLAGSDAARVVELIAVEPAARPAGEAIGQDPTVVRLLPAYDQLSAAGKAFVDRLRKASDTDDEVVTETSRVQELDGDDRITEANRERDPDEKRAVERAQAMHELDAIAALPAAIDALLAGDLRREPSSLVALLASHRAQVPELLTEATHWSRVAQLARRLDVPPHVACPFLSIDLLLQMPNALRWYFELDDKTVLLGAAGRPGAANLLAQHLAADVPSARDWLKGLPRGAGLTDDERRSLDRIEAATGNADVIRQLFVTRFDVQPPLVAVPDEKEDDPRGVGYNSGDLDSLYRLASRLPASHLDQRRIQRIAAVDTPNALGMWDGGTVRLDPGLHEGLADGTFHPDTHAKDSDEGWLTTDEVKREFGYDDARIAAQVAARNLITKDVDGLTLYKMKPVELDLFTQVALHEIGHSVDSMLGAHTAVVFDHAGWHEFNDAGFDTWAAEMGGWDRVSAADKVKIREAWIDATREHKGVHQLVSPDHPALHERNAGVAIVDSARDGKSFQRDERVAHNGRVFIAGSYEGTWYSLKAEVVPSAPSYYSLHAPQEYFAESYVEYYRQVDGSPGSEAKKGGGLAAPVKQFFDQHVDTLKYDPRRFESPDS